MLYKTKLTVLVLFVSLIVTGQVFAGATTANGWYEEEEIYYIPDGHPKSPTCGHLKIPHPLGPISQ